ncbi:MAG: hypothetical protein IKE57_05670 [Oscillospiraceae bacterium]|nr:hypothetical protein [Oscillospiraceae bacterium]
MALIGKMTEIGSVQRGAPRLEAPCGRRLFARELRPIPGGAPVTGIGGHRTVFSVRAAY